MARERVGFLAAGVDAPRLDGELWLPDTGDPVAGVVVTHPHPLRGGSMDNNVVIALCQGLQAAGIASLRFDFRGVRRSEGGYGEGVDEVSDVLGALSYLAEQPQIASDRIGLAGYSFGARVSLAAAPKTPQIRALLCVAPPLREQLPADAQPACPLLVMVGDRDGVLAEGAERYASYLPSPQVLRVVPGTDHFWRGFEPVLTDAAREFFAACLSGSGAEVSS
jgi:hypothetical protein